MKKSYIIILLLFVFHVNVYAETFKITNLHNFLPNR